MTLLELNPSIMPIIREEEVSRVSVLSFTPQSRCSRHDQKKNTVGERYIKMTFFPRKLGLSVFSARPERLLFLKSDIVQGYQPISTVPVGSRCVASTATVVVLTNFTIVSHVQAYVNQKKNSFLTDQKPSPPYHGGSFEKCYQKNS